ncbi:uncharacterized protein LOC125501996 [Athalia rosae]|uniref:uncharacterized protein LOC125501996 n=1 Tax=Athalia rosae TaxID=37344 RepID=UPI0020340B30|nr:uncharacterized protein LOC125501996 [Athalia rosae]
MCEKDLIPSLIIRNAIFRYDFTEITSLNPENATTERLTLLNLNGPIIPQDTVADMQHVRVKREFRDFDSFDSIDHGQDNLSRDGYKSNVKNNSADAHAKSIDDSPHPSSAVTRMRKKRFNYEMLFPRSYLKNENETLVSNAASGYQDDKQNKQKSSAVVGIPSRILDANNLHRKLTIRRRHASYRNSGTHREAKKKYHAKPHKHKHRKKPNRKKPHSKSEETESDESVDKQSETRALMPSLPKLNTISKLRSSSIVDGLQVEGHVEKRDSGYPKSEIDMKKREVSENARFKRHERLENDHKMTSSNHVDCKRYLKKNEDLRYYDDVREPPRPFCENRIHRKSAPVSKLRRGKATRSVEQIKDLMEKLIDKVDELGKYVDTDGESNEAKNNAKKSSQDNLSNTTSSFDADAGNITRETSRESTNCIGKTAKSDVTKVGQEKSGNRILSRRQASKKNRSKRNHRKKWDKWTDWSSCSVTCGKGRQIRWRHCVHDCTMAETEMEEKQCQLPACSPGKFLGIF